MIRSLLVDMHDAEAGRLHARHLEAADGHVGAGVDVLLEHQLVVHLVDVVAGEDDHELGAVALDDVDVLEDRVGGAGVPLRLRDALARRQDVEALVALGAEEVPAALQVADQAVGLVLGGDADAADARVQRVREREVDDPGLAAEIDRRLGPLVGQLHQAAAAAAGEHIGHGIARRAAPDVRMFSAVVPPYARLGRLNRRRRRYSVGKRRQADQRRRAGLAVRAGAPPSTPPRLPSPLPPIERGVGVDRSRASGRHAAWHDVAFARHRREVRRSPRPGARRPALRNQAKTEFSASSAISHSKPSPSQSRGVQGRQVAVERG